MASLALFMNEITDTLTKNQILESFSYSQAKLSIDLPKIDTKFVGDFNKATQCLELAANIDPNLELKATVYANDQLFGVTFNTLAENKIKIIKLFKINRREAFRYKIPQAYDIKIKISNETKLIQKSLKLYDISVEGLGLKLEPGLNLKVGDKVYLEFMINQKEVSGEGEVKGIFKIKEGKEDIMKIGIKFKKMSHFSAGYITSYINQQVSQYSKKI